MKFKQTEKSGSSKKDNRLTWTVSLFMFFLFRISGFAQPVHFEFDNTPVPKALTRVAREMNIKIAFDAGELQKYKISGFISEVDAGSIIKTVIRDTGFSLTVKYDTYLIIRKESESQKRKSFRVLFLTGKAGNHSLMRRFIARKRTGP